MLSYSSYVTVHVPTSLVLAASGDHPLLVGVTAHTRILLNVLLSASDSISTRDHAHMLL